MFPPGTLEAFGLVAIRTSAMVLASPVIGTGTSFTGFKVAIIVALSFIFYSASGTPLAVSPSPLIFGAMAARELLLGAFLGFISQIVMLSVKVAGELIAHEMGMFMARQADPATGASSALVTKVYENFSVLALLAVNGHHILIQAVHDSVRVAPVGHVTIGAGLGEMTQRMVAEMFGAGLAFAAPIMIFLMLTSILLGLLSRAVSQLNILEVSFTLRVGISLVAMYLFAPMIEPAFDQLLESYVRWMEGALEALTPAGEGR